jgi:hypothetical protein
MAANAMSISDLVFILVSLSEIDENYLGSDGAPPPLNSEVGFTSSSVHDEKVTRDVKPIRRM